MRVDIKIPPLGESVVEVTIGAILKPSGSRVREEEEVVEIETDKVNQVLSAPISGRIEFSVKTGDIIKIGQTIGFVESSEDSSSAKMVQPTLSEKKPLPSSFDAIPSAPRKKVDQALQEMTVSGERETVRLRPEETPFIKNDRETRKKMTTLRRVIAERLVEAKNQTALLTTFNELDMSSILTVREKEQESFQKKHGVKLGFMSFFIKACVSALQEFPGLNARIDQDEIIYSHHFDIGVAVSTEKGLMVPIIRDADVLSYAEIEKKLKEFAEKARNGTISVDEMQGGTFTITNGGVFGSLLSTPILNPPQSGILGMHNIVKRPIAINNDVVIRPMMYLALSYDHRIVDGKESILFLVHMKKNLEDPTRFLLDL